MTLMVSVVWDVRRGSMETCVTDNVQAAVRQVVIDQQDNVMETVQ